MNDMISDLEGERFIDFKCMFMDYIFTSKSKSLQNDRKKFEY